MDHANERFSSDFSSSDSNGKLALNAINAKDTETETSRFLRWSFSSLLAFQEHASTASAGRGSYQKGEFLPASHPQNCSYAHELQYGVPYHHGHAYDLNLPPNGTAAEFSSRINPQIAPITPEKRASVKHRQVAPMQCLSTYEMTNQESNEQVNGVATTAAEGNRLHTDGELQTQEKDTSTSAVYTVDDDSHSPDKGSNAVGVIETPEQKPRRRKHRPKVVTEGKPKPQRPVTPKQTPDAVNPTGKRKYVRKKPLSKNPTTNPTESTETPTGTRKYVRQTPLNKISTAEEVTAESTNTKALDPAKKSCRRSLNFDIEGQTGDGNFKCKPNLNEESRRQVHDLKCRSRPKSIVTLGHGVEVVVENTETGTAYDLASSIEQMLYTLFPEKQAPNTPQTVTNCPLGGKWSSESQENNAEGEHRLTADNAQQKTPQIELQTGNHLPPINPSACYDTYTTLSREVQANRSKRKLSSVTQQSYTNLNGIFYNALPEYEAAPWLQFPTKNKIRRSEKAHNATISSISSLPTWGGRLDTTGPQNNTRGNPSASTLKFLLPFPHTSSDKIPGTFREKGDLQYNVASGFVLTQTQVSTEKKTNVPTQPPELASVTKILRGPIHPSYNATQAPMDYNVQHVGDTNRFQACMGALVHETLTTERRILVSAASSSTDREQSDGKIIIYNQNQFSANSFVAPLEVIKRQKPSIDANDLQHVDIRRDVSSSNHIEENALVPYGIRNEVENALVPYNSDGTIIPLTDSFIKKKRSRAKVYLDEETNKVWKLLMENINNEGIDGTDEEKEKWWEEERKVFRGRADSFIARMHLVQGDRRFSQWKGSVVDSVVGVFLTQNVSDHLSSSAFMSLAARFPLKPQDNNQPSYEERMDSEIDKPIVCIPDLEDATKWNEEIFNQSICDQTSMTLHDSELDEEKEVVHSKESSTSSTGIFSSNGPDTYYEAIENRTTREFIKITDTCDEGEKMSTTNDVLSSQNSVVSSQNSVDTLITLTAERKEAFIENNPEADLMDKAKSNSLNSCSSFMDILRKAGSSKLHGVHSNCNKVVLPEQRSKYEINTQNVENDSHMQNKYCVDTPKSSTEVPTSPSHNYHLHLSFKNTEAFQMNSEETRCSNKTNSSNSMKEPPFFTEESASQITVENNPSMAIQVLGSPMTNNSPCSKAEDKHVSIQSPSKDHNMAKSETQVQNNEMQQIVYMPNLSEEIPDTIEGSSALHKPENTLQKRAETDMIEHDISKVKEIDGMNASKRKAKSRRVGNEIRDDVDWDALRKQAEENCGKRQRTLNTMDSLDWEAIRCANVSEIADTIKERGMNNRLAERIKDFLNRLVKEHGSIDLEWLRDVPPDKAKEYLLSIRGLGLKSVECVRLLTLHHLAFPVDTNVGRIAVRLGWVPLQPLPESLQLHLLELYPVLESIQKYLWPRLCKLDQRTLYELHYQMITFGKVFCTKNKPNCNACPMRGECRHFASAFASARLALPGPEEKGIVSATKNRANKSNPDVMVREPLLPLPQAIEPSEEYQLSKSNQQSEARYGFSSCEPIVEEPLSPEIERIQVSEHDMEDTLCEDPDEIPTINLNIEEFTHNLQNYMQNNMELQQSEMSKALVALTAEAASIPTPKLKNVSRLRTEHQVYELPDSHPLLQGVDRREPDDPCSYLLAIWTPGETPNSIQPPESSCNWQEYGKLCDEKTCFSCNSIREADSQIVRGTLLIPCRTAMRGSFPLNGTYFQVNEVFADHESSLNPINVPRSLIWNLPRRTVYFGTSIPTIFKGLTTEGIQHCFWKGFVCVRGFDQKTRAPRPLIARLHFPASKLKAKGKDSNDQRTPPSDSQQHIQNDR